MTKNSPSITNTNAMQKSTFALGPNNVSDFNSTAHSNYQPLELVPLTDGKPRAAHINHSTLLLGKNHEPIVSTAKVAFQEPIDPPHYQKVTKNLQASTFSIGTSKLDESLVSTQQANYAAPDPNFHIDNQNPELKASHLEFKEISMEDDKKFRRASTAFEQYRDPHIEHVPELYHMDLQKGSGIIQAQGSEKLVNWDTTNRQTFKGVKGSPVSSKADQYSRQSHFEMGRDPMPSKSTTKESYVKHTSNVQPPRHKGDIERSTVEIGDPQRVKDVESTQRSSYPKYDHSLQPMNKPNTAAMRETHFLMGKYGPDWNTTAHENYKSHKIEPQEKHYMNLQKGSDPIPNDRSKINEMTTTNQSSYQTISPKQAALTRSQPAREKEWLRGTHFELGKDRANFNSTNETTFQDYGLHQYQPAQNRTNYTTLVLGDKKKWKDYETSAKTSYGTPSPQPIQSLYDKYSSIATSVLT